MTRDSYRGNLNTLRDIGYTPLDTCFLLAQVDDELIDGCKHELSGKRKYLEFGQGEVSGYIWYNHFLERWFCDVYKRFEYVETLVASDIHGLVKSVHAIYVRVSAGEKGPV